MKSPQRLIFPVLLAVLGVLVLAGQSAGQVRLLKGQTLYVPAYTTFARGTDHLELRPVLYIHNADPATAINIVRLDYYDSHGKLSEKYLPKPQKLDPLAGTRFLVKNPLKDAEGMGASFVLQWQAEKKVVEPLVQGVFFGSIGTRGYSFTASPRIMQEESN
jgi:hypothetical protein